MTPSLVVGLGSPHGDDSVGWLVVDRLSAESGGNVIIRRASSPVEITDWLDGIQRLVICDACQPSGRPGRLHRWTWPTSQLRQLKSPGSHDFDLCRVLRLAETLHQLPARVVIFGVECAMCEPDGAVSVAITEAIPQVVAAIRSELFGGRVVH